MVKNLRSILFFSFLLMNFALYAQPANDDCMNAIAIGQVEDEPFSTEMATTDGPAHPNDCTSAGASPDTLWKDVWYLFTADFTGTCAFSTCSSASFDTKIAIYGTTNCPVSDDDLIGCNEDGPGCGGATSFATFEVVDGMSYLLRLGGWGDGGPGEEGTGSFDVLEYNPPPGPPNDNCADAITLDLGVADSVVVEFTNLNANTDGPTYAETFECFDVPNGETNVFSDIWYEWTATFSGWVDWSNCGTSGFDSRMAVYGPNESCPPDPFALVGCNDDGLDDNNFNCNAFTSRTIFEVEEGSTYLFALGAFAGGQGEGTFYLKRTLPLVPPPNDNCLMPDTAWVITTEQADNFDEVFQGFTSSGTYFTQTPKPTCRPSGEFQDVWHEFNSGNNTELEIRFNKVTPNTNYIIDLFETCTSVADTAGAGFCYRTDLSTDDYQIFTVDGLPGVPTDYILRISTRITTDAPGEYWFQLVGEPFNPVSVAEIDLKNFRFAPNPLTDRAYVEFDLDQSENVQIDMVNVLGQVVETFQHGTLPAGANRLDYSFDHLQNGIYFFRMSIGDQQKTVRVVKN